VRIFEDFRLLKEASAALIVLFMLSAPAMQETALDTAQIYSVSTEKTIAGTGFLVAFQDELYAVAAVHPYEGLAPTNFIGAKGAEVQLGPRVFSHKDVQVLRVERRLSDASDPFAFGGPSAPTAGARLAVVIHSGAMAEPPPGKPSVVVFGKAATGEELELEKPFRPTQTAGSPVVSLDTGAVVGVVTHEGDGEPTTRVKFEPLLFRGEAGPQWKAEMFVGSWVASNGAMTTLVTLGTDGSFNAKYLVGSSFVGKVEGRWELRNREIVWRYDQDYNGLFSVDEDANRIVSVSKDSFSLREREGVVTVFTRKTAQPE
jgi:hypothetical protein